MFDPVEIFGDTGMDGGTTTVTPTNAAEVERVDANQEHAICFTHRNGTSFVALKVNNR